MKRQLDWSLANEFAVGVHVEWGLGFHSHARGQKILDAVDRHVSAEIDSRKHAEQFEGVNASDHADIELAVIHSRMRRNLHAAAISGSVGESGQERGLTATGDQASRFVRRENLYLDRSKAKNRRRKS